MKIETLRKLAGREEIDYPFLLSALKEYSQPRDKISAWLKSGDLIRVKKGLYIFGKNAAENPYSQEVLANLIYGPSAISLHYALSYYGLIPERVSTVTSITNKRYKEFSTPVGNFIYYYLHPSKYAIGIELESIAKNKQFLIASPEKSICDILYLSSNKLLLSDITDIESYLIHDLRIDTDHLKKLNMKKLAEINGVYQDKKIALLYQFIKKRVK